MQSGLHEKRANEVELGELVDREDAFDIFSKWIYTGDYNVSVEKDHSKRCLLHARVYALAERLMTDELKTIVLSAMRDEFVEMRYDQESVKLEELVDLIEIVYAQLPDYDKLRDCHNESEKSHAGNPAVDTKRKRDQDTAIVDGDLTRIARGKCKLHKPQCKLKANID